MKKLSTLQLSAAGTSARMERGKVDIEKGFVCVGLRLKMTIVLANASGGNVTLTDAQKQNLLDNFSVTLSYGKNGSFVPLQAVDLTDLHILHRYAYGSEFEGYTDATTGLGQTIADAGTKTMVIYPCIPTGKLWFLRDQQHRLGAGRSQSKTFQLDIRRNASVTIATGVTISGTVTVEVIPDLRPAEGDRWSVLPELETRNETDRVAKFSEGMPLLVGETSYVHASSTLTNISFKIDDQLIHDQVSPAELITEYNDAASLPSAASPTDRLTVIYALTDETSFEELPTGTPQLVQNVKNLTTFNGFHYFIPLIRHEQWATEIENVATTIRNKTIKAVSLPTSLGKEVPSRIQPFAGARLFDNDDKEMEKYAGKLATPHGRAMDVIPPSLAAAAKAAAAIHVSNGERKAADDVAKRVAKQIPGSVESARGMAAGKDLTQSLMTTRRQLLPTS